MENPEGSLWLAPMAGVTDRPFRTLAREQGCDMAFTEMVSAQALTRSNPKTWCLLDIEKGSPIGVQLFGCCPQTLAEAARIAEAKGADMIDINMGCPVPKVVNSGGGAALLRNPQLAELIVKQVAAAVSIPLTVKLRAGWDNSSLNAPVLAQRLAAAGAAAIAIHGRTRAQMYTGAADWQIIAEAVKIAGVPIIGNGDVWSGKDALSIWEQTGCQGVMIARGALGNPWLFAEIKAAFANENYSPPAPKLRIDLAIRHLKMELAYRGREKGLLFMRKHLAWYLKGLPGSAALRRAMFTSVCPEAVEDMLVAFIDKTR